MKPLNCKIQTLVNIPLDENIEEERELMEFAHITEKQVPQWNDGILLEVQPVTSKFISEGYHNEQTTFYGLVWDTINLTIKALPLEAIKIEEKEVDRLMRREWGN